MGLCLQFGAFSRVTHKFGLLRSFRCALLLFTIPYLLAPYLVLLPTRSSAPAAADGAWVWIGICFLLLIQVTSRTFALPITQILMNNSVPHPSVLSSVHGLGLSVGAGFRTLGPVLWSYLYGLGLQRGTVGLAFWTLSAEALAAFLMSQFVYEGNGHEIRLNGEDGDPLQISR